MSARTRRSPRPTGHPAPRPATPAAAEPRTWRVAVLVFVALLVIYLLNFRIMAAGDSLPTRLLPFSVLREGNLDLDEFTWRRGPTARLPYYVHKPGAHIYSVSTVATALVVTPLYILPAWWLASHGISYDDVRARVVIAAMERLAASTLTALSAALLFVVLRRLTTWRWALALAGVYGLGTSSWTISSQALWAHALSELCLVGLSAFLLSAAPSRTALAVAGLIAAVMVANRPQMIVFAAPALLFVWAHHRRQVLAFAALPAVIGALLIAYNHAIFHTLAGGYGDLRSFDGPLLEGLAGLVVSPNRGLLVYTPIMIFGLWGAVQVWRVEAPAWLRWMAVGLVLHVLVYGKFREWWAGYTYGPRYFTDVLPALTIFLVYGLVPWCRGRTTYALAAGLALYGVAVQAIGVYAADDGWNREPVPLERRPSRVWDWSDLQIVRGLHNGWHAGEAAPLMLDAFRQPVPAQITQLSEADLASAIAVHGLPAVVRRGGMVSGVAEITNHGRRAWPAFSGEGMIGNRYLTFLLLRWLVQGQPLPGQGDEIPLPQNASPGATVAVPFALAVPLVAGDLELELRVTQLIDSTHGLAGPDPLRVRIRVD